MRVRALDANGDMTFGQGGANFLVNSPACVAQCVKTRLLLGQGEWFLDVTAGTPWSSQILGKHVATADQAIRGVVLATQGVSAILLYASSLDPTTRKFTVTYTLDTIYGPADPQTVVLPFGQP